MALAVALVLRRATIGTAAAAARRFADYARQVGDHHFDDEERLLAPHLDVAVGARIRAEHEALRAAATACAAPATPSLADLHAAGALLADHVRFEEREVFPDLEKRCSATQLEALGQQLVAHGHPRGGQSTAEG